MNNSTYEIIPVEENLPIKQIKKNGRPPLPLEQKKVKDSSYFKNYYHTSGLSDTIKCDICMKSITRQKLKRHQKTNNCKNICARNARNSELSDIKDTNENINEIIHNEEPNTISQLEH